MNPTQAQLDARLNPTPTQVSTPTTGLFRGLGDYGQAIYGTDSSGKGVNYNLIGGGSNNPLFSSDAERASFGNAGGQAAEAVKRLKSNYGIDYSSLPQVNLADYMQKMLNTNGFSTQPADWNSLKAQPVATLTTQTLNNTPNILGVPQSNLASANANGGSSLAAAYSGPSVVDYLSSTGQASNMAARTKLAESMGINNYTGSAAQNTQLLNSLRSQSTPTASNVPTIPAGSTPFGVVSPSASLPLSSTGTTFDSSAIGGQTTQGVLDTRQSYENTINSYLKAQADAQAALNQTQATQLQGQANIMYGVNGTGGHDANLQGAELQQFDRQMAFQTVPAQIALQNAQVALSLFKQTPQYLNETQARDTSFNLLQSYPDINYQYDPSKSAQANLQAIKGQLSTSAKYQASLVNYRGWTDANGTFHLYNSKDPNTVPQGINTPSASNPVTPAGTYIGTSGGSITQPQPVQDKPVTKTQVNFTENWNSGAIGTAKNALNTAVGHLFEADQLYGSLNNSDNTVMNMVRNSYGTLTGKDAATNYETAQTLASNELSSAYGGDAQGDRNKLAQFGGANQSPSQHAGYVQTSTSLLASKLGAMAEQYKGAFNHYPSSLDSLISPLNQIKLSAFTKSNLNGIVPGVGISPSTQAMMNTAQIVGGKVYLPDANGNYQPQE